MIDVNREALLATSSSVSLSEMSSEMSSEMATGDRAIHPPARSRRWAIRSGAASAIGAWPAVACARAKPDRSLNKALVSIVRCRAKAATLEKLLIAAIAATAPTTTGEEAPDAEASTVSPREIADALGLARAGVKEIVTVYKLEENYKAAVLYLRPKEAEVAAEHGFTALEYLGSVVEFDAVDYWDRNFEGKLAKQVTPEKLVFCRKAIATARTELATFAAAFDPEAYSDAEAFWRAYGDM